MAPSREGMYGVPNRHDNTDRFPPISGPSATPDTSVSAPQRDSGGCGDSSNWKRRSAIAGELCLVV